MRARAMSSQLCRCLSSGISSLTFASVLKMSSGSPDSAAQRNGPIAATEQRADIGGHEAGEVERVGDALLLRHLADVVAVVDGGNAGAMEIEHRAHMHRHRRARGLVDRLGVALATLLPLRERPAARQIAVDRIMRRGLVGHGVGPHAAAQQFGKDVGGVAEQPDGNRLALASWPCR